MAARSMREREMIKGRLSRVRPADHPDRPIEVGRRRTGPEKEGDKQKNMSPPSKQRKGEREGFTSLV